MLNNFRITQRFSFVLIAFWISFMTIVVMGFWGMSMSQNSLKIVHQESMGMSLKLDAMNDTLNKNRMQILLAFQHAPDGPLANIHDHPTKLHTDALENNRASVDQILKELSDLSEKNGSKALFQTMQAKREAYRLKVNVVVKAIKANDFSPEIMAAFLAAARVEAEAALDSAVQLRNFYQEQGAIAYKEAESRFKLAVIIAIGIVVLLGIPASWMTLTLFKRLKSGFSAADTAASSIAEGDLSKPISFDGQDEIAALLEVMENMRSKLHSLLVSFREAADSIASSASEVATGTLDLSGRTEQQAHELEKTTSASDQLNGTVKLNAESAAEASKLAFKAADTATAGGAVVANVVITMDEINASSKKIVDIISVIDGIAFQTNILALNAAVEAARAGEQGRGFAVVASEVRSLAGRSAEAAKEIKNLITNSVEKVALGTSQVASAGSTMEEIVSSIARVASIVGEIAQASREQSAGIGQINQSVLELDDVTQQNAALVEETSAISATLQDQAQKLADLSASFKLIQRVKALR
jgi:methyl-accepting chemotaxis protein